MRDDLVGGLFDLPHALEIAHRIGVVFDADAEQRGERGIKLRGQSLQRLDLYDLSAFDPIDRGARNTELFGDVVGGMPAFDPIGFEAAADIAEPRCRAPFPLSHN